MTGELPATQAHSAHAASALTLIHGWAMHGGLFASLCAALEPVIPCRTLDLPGHGLNRAQRWPASIDDWLAERIPAGSWLAGWSLGGLLAMRIALARRIRLRGLVLIAATPCFLRRPHWPHGIPASQLQTMADELAADPQAVIQRFLALEVHGDKDAATQLRVLRSQALTHGIPSVTALQAGLELLRDTDLTDRLAKLDLPVLLIGGRRDRVVNWPALQATARRLPHAELALIPGAAHAPFLTRPQAVANAIAGFIRHAQYVQG